MTMIGLFREKNGDEYPPIAELISPVPIDKKREVLKYMKRSRCIAALPAIFRDVFTGESIKGDTVVKGDGVYCWWSYVEYYFDKYNLKLPDEFIERVTSDGMLARCISDKLRHLT